MTTLNERIWKIKIFIYKKIINARHAKLQKHTVYLCKDTNTNTNIGEIREKP